MFTMAALAAFKLLDADQKASLMPLVGFADEKKGLDGSWDAVLVWCDVQNAARQSQRGRDHASKAHRAGTKGSSKGSSRPGRKAGS